ncbi:MAG: hypothetical protein ACLFWM_10935 [Actinomycetota bacterium]
MRLFVATRAGADAGDYFHTVEGELVRLPIICDDPDCGCTNSMTGMGSGLSTTTFTVREFEIDRDTYHDLLWGTLERDGWVEEGSREDVEWVARLVDLHLDLADKFTPGTPLRLAGDRLTERR